MQQVIKIDNHLCTLQRYNSTNRTLQVVSPFFGPGIVYLSKGTARAGRLNYRDYATGKYKSVEVTLL